ncbi:MAG: hypothetical protein IKV17_01890 [Bacteroidaceae bacterium]|nr:hypothetical protein [Bacteroidaceae bacterium]
MEKNLKNYEPSDVEAAQAQPNEIPQESMNNVQTASYAEFEKELQQLLGKDFRLDDEMSQDMLIMHIKKNKEQSEQLAEALERDPRLAQMLVDVIDGKRSAHASMARYFGRSMMELDESSPEFEEMMIADEERRDEMYRLVESRREYESNLEASRPIIEQFCSEKGYEPADFMEMVWEKVVFPVLSGKYSYEVCTALDHSLTYEQDVEDAFAAGDIKGRNTNIQRMKGDIGDGLPKGLQSAAPVDNIKRRKGNSLIEAALKA